jgi:hypothetical protein
VTSPISGRALGVELCALWGLEADRVESIVIRIRPNSWATATVRILADDDAARLIKTFRLEGGK